MPRLSAFKIFKPGVFKIATLPREVSRNHFWSKLVNRAFIEDPIVSSFPLKRIIPSPRRVHAGYINRSSSL